MSTKNSEKVQLIDCNDCVHMFPTENDQREYSYKTGHYCDKFDTFCKHQSQERNHYMLYPCEQCVNNNYEDFKKKR